MTSKRKRITAANRAAWNEVTPLHQRAAKEKWDKAFRQPGYVCLNDTEIDTLNKIGIKDKAVAHLCCNNGVEIASHHVIGESTVVVLELREASDNIRFWFLAIKDLHNTSFFELGPSFFNENNRLDDVHARLLIYAAQRKSSPARRVCRQAILIKTTHANYALRFASGKAWSGAAGVRRVPPRSLTPATSSQPE
jgi:hypothetical protein